MTQRVETQELLEALMAGHKMTSDELDELLRRRVPEDLFLEYKHADELNYRKKANRTMRQYLSGFANSAGGTIIIGIDQNTWEVTPCQTVSGDLAEWAARCLTEIAHYFSPPPRFQVVEHPKGKVLVATTSRSVGLVPCKEKGELVYYMRFHDQTLNNKTLKVPEYLIGDLVLGRRRRPHLHIRQLSLALRASEQPQYQSRLLTFGMNFMIENANLAWANEVRLGIVRYIPHQPLSLSNHLLSYIDIPEFNNRFTGGSEYNLNHKVISGRSGLTIDLDPFSVVTLNVPGNKMPIRILDKFYRYSWKAAAYLMSKESPPVWYQIQIEVSDPLLKAANEAKEISCDSSLVKITRLTSERPIVSWDGFGDKRRWLANKR